MDAEEQGEQKPSRTEEASTVPGAAEGSVMSRGGDGITDGNGDGDPMQVDDDDDQDASPGDGYPSDGNPRDGNPTPSTTATAASTTASDATVGGPTASATGEGALSNSVSWVSRRGD